MFREIINLNPLLQNRDDHFYSKFLEELKSDRFNKGDFIAKSGQQVEWVFFIVSGVVENTTTNRFYESGQMINHDIVMRKSIIMYDFQADTDVSVLKYSKATFLQILD